jgi:hypothetical protein
MPTLYATQVTSMSELKKNSKKLTNDVDEMPTVIFKHNSVDESELKRIVKQRLSEPVTSVKVELDDL